MTPQETQLNQTTLVELESLGCVFVWDAEVFVVAFMDKAISDEISILLRKLTGVQQIAIDASIINFSELKALASMPGLRSLVLLRSTLNASQSSELRLLVPELIFANE